MLVLLQNLDLAMLLLLLVSMKILVLSLKDGKLILLNLILFLTRAGIRLLLGAPILFLFSAVPYLTALGILTRTSMKTLLQMPPFWMSGLSINLKAFSIGLTQIQS